MIGSKCVPASSRNNAAIFSRGHASLYARFELNASKTSATATMRAKIGIDSPAKPRG